MDCIHLKSYNAELYRQLVCYPQEVIPTFDMTVNDLFQERHGSTVLEHQIQVSHECECIVLGYRLVDINLMYHFSEMLMCF